ncbi:MAG: hypothetical protein WC806_04850, partial [Candidatus Gracilibacteria bacterium]
EHRQSMQIRIYAAVCVVILIGMGVYSYIKWQEYAFIRDGVEINTQRIAEIKDEISYEKNTYFVTKPDFDTLGKEIENKVSVIFPKVDEYKELTKQLDVYEKELSSKNNPFEIKDISYSADNNKLDGYSVLPFTINISTTLDNFNKFFHLIENSGSLDNPIRIMDISSIRLTFGEFKGEEVKDKTMNFTMSIQAYYQK